MRSWRWLLLSLVLVAFVTGCQEEDAAPTEGPRSIAATATGVAPAGDRFHLENLANNLRSLQRHRTLLNADFQDADGNAHWHLTSDQTTLPEAIRLEVAANGAILQDAIGSFTMTQVGRQSYLLAPGVGCIGGSDEEVLATLQGPLDPDYFLAGLNGASLVEASVLVNGTVTQRYHFDEGSLPLWQDRPVEVSGDVFVSQDTGRLHRATMTISGEADYLARDVPQDGTLAVSIDVFDVGSDVKIMPPSACVQSERYPLVEDAFGIATIEDLLAYQTRLSVGEVVDFYEGEMLTQGWQSDAEAVILDDRALLTYRRGQEQIVVTIERDQADDLVNVIVAP